MSTFNPVATYRIQFHKDFTLRNLEEIIPYLKNLGVSTIYASPLFAAVPGSTHGYDVTDPLQINPEIGTVEQLREISATLKSQGINWVQDIVPNHMAFHPNNKWLMDVLEKGALSPYANFFDMAGNSDLFEGPVMVPFLGSALKDVIDNDELKITFSDGGFSMQYYDSAYPLKLSSYAEILSAKTGKNESLSSLLQQIENLIKGADEAEAFATEFEEIKLQLRSLYNITTVKKFIDACIDTLNNDKDKLKALIGSQHYRLCSWQETDSKINFRRFFTVNGLICLNMQRPEVFSKYHELIKLLVDEGVFQGLRVDHIDGLYDPTAYLQMLRELAGADVYIVAEKILEQGEKLPVEWPIQGTSGYDYLALVNNLLTNTSTKNTFDKLYEDIAGKQSPVEQLISEKKAHILSEHMGGELNNLLRYFYNLNLVDEKRLKSVKYDDLKQAIAWFLIYCPVYRFYGNKLPLSVEEAGEVSVLLSKISNEQPELKDAVGLLKSAFLDNAGDDDQGRLKFYQRCMQFSGPLMAKGVEDTLMYTYNRFVGHNEVGDAPDAFGISTGQYHTLMAERQKDWPLAMSGTSTHDTKRGEDVRARLAAISDIPQEWSDIVSKWRADTNGYKSENAPDANDEYLIYQTIAGSYPMPGQDIGNYEERLHEYLEKALREAKQHSQWAEPNIAYEDATKQFVSSLIKNRSPFLKSFEPFYKKIADVGIINSLTQVALKFTSPGLPDVYQGCERWDLSLVDPDNRRPVDYAPSQDMLQELNAEEDRYDLNELWKERYSGKIKLWLTQKLHNIRKAHAEVFEKGEYLPLEVKGKLADHLIAFARVHNGTWMVTIAPIHTGGLFNDEVDITGIDWEDTHVKLPANAPKQCTNLLISKKIDASEKLNAADIFNSFAVGIFKLESPANPRGGGILMHITSLPSAFGVGDMGPEAIRFANFLADAGQKYWQILPLNPTEPSAGNSPYSSFSSMAGNTLLISPELLVEEGLLSDKDLANAKLAVSDKADYEKAQHVRETLFYEAWSKFKSNRSSSRDYNAFCEKEATWLDDFALYTVLKQHHENKAWYEWPKRYRLREATALQSFIKKQGDAIAKAKWLQYIFSKQWLGLKAYCNERNIKLIGDMPFYISYDSADVWANIELFDLDDEGKMLSVAGVPPDYFNADGQLWGMPIFCWEKHQETGYEWWIQRIKKNIELCDILRLDHFRAFSAYWEVPADEKTAVNGKWQQGPGEPFFRALKDALGDLPFIAEDLGDIDDAVYSLRDSFNLPGMRVLQFAFGDELPASPYIPHNYTPNSIAYTGTHDNNTMKGWYTTDADAATKKRLKDYTGVSVNANNVHQVLYRLLLSSVAETVIVPVQDVLGLGGDARMNLPASTDGNWAWRLTDLSVAEKLAPALHKQAAMYNRL